MAKSDLETEFEALVRQQKSNIYSVCYMFASSGDEADDLFQEVLVNLWRGFERFRNESSVSTWTYRVSMNTCISHRRKKSVAAVRLEGQEVSAYEEVEQNPQTRLLHRRIKMLEPFDRAIVLLWLEDLPYDEIGAIVGLSSKAVGVRLVRIREKLKKLQS